LDEAEVKRTASLTLRRYDAMTLRRYDAKWSPERVVS
jgi:hypothetical protein